MNFQQLQVVHEIAKRGFCLRDAAAALSYSQNNVRKHIKDFENELGLQVFDRCGKTIKGLSAVGGDLMEVIERIQTNIQKLRTIQHPSLQLDKGVLRIGATSTEARYILPDIIRIFQAHFPSLQLQIRIGSQSEIKELLIAAEVDMVLGHEFAGPWPELTLIKAWDWPLALVVPERHPLTAMETLTLEALAVFPLVTYHQGIQGRRRIDAVFSKSELEAEVVLSAESDDIIMAYVELGFGVGILAPMAFQAQRDQGLKLLNAGHLFGRMTTGLGLRRGHALTKYVYQVIERFAPQSSAR